MAFPKSTWRYWPGACPSPVEYRVLASPSTALAATSPVQHELVGPLGLAVAVQPAAVDRRLQGRSSWLRVARERAGEPE